MLVKGRIRVEKMKRFGIAINLDKSTFSNKFQIKGSLIFIDLKPFITLFP